MTDQLRDRIAAVLYGNLRRQQSIDRPDRYLYWIDPSELAGAVIAELALKKEYGSLDPEMSGCLYDEGEKITVCPGEKVYYRYITDWIEVKEHDHH